MASGNPYAATITSGALDTQLDLQQIQMNSQKIQTARVDLLKDKIGLAQQLKMLSLMQGLKPGEGGDTPDTMAGMMDQMSMIQLESGLPDAAAKSATVATKIREDSSLINYRQYRLQMQRLGEFANILDSVPDSPQGMQQALMLMRITDPGAVRDPKFQMLSKMPWRPGLIAAIKNSVISQKDKAEITYRKQATEAAQSRVVADQHREKLVDAQTQYYKDRDKALGKEGASVVKAAQLQPMTDLATRDFPGADPADIRVRSRRLVEQALRLMKSNHLTQSEAYMQVYQEAKKNGTFNGMRQFPGRRGASAKNPLPAPADPSKIIDNQWYTDKDGEPVLALGGKFYTQQELTEAESEDEDLTEDQDEDSEYPEERTQPDDFVPAR